MHHLYNSMARKDEISAAKAYLATIEREKRAKRARDEFRKYRKGAEKAVSTLPGRYEDLPRKTLDKIERDENALLDKRVRNERQAKKNRARYEKKFKDEERNLPKQLPFESTKIQKARLQLAERVIEGMTTGASPTRTGARVGAYIKKLRKSVDAGEKDPKVLGDKLQQVTRIAGRVAGRRGKSKKDFDQAFDDFGRGFKQGRN